MRKQSHLACSVAKNMFQATGIIKAYSCPMHHDTTSDTAAVVFRQVRPGARRDRNRECCQISGIGNRVVAVDFLKHKSMEKNPKTKSINYGQVAAMQK